VVTILATPVGNVSGGAVPRTIEVRLTGIANLKAPTAVITPDPHPTVAVNQVTTFDASNSTDEDDEMPCLDLCTYTWTLGTEATRAGRIITHAFLTPGIHSVTLTVRDAAGLSGSAQQSVTVTALARPTAAFSFSPSDPQPNETVFFNASQSTAPAGATITQWTWDFGDGKTDDGLRTEHKFEKERTYRVLLTVTDSAGQTGTTTLDVVVAIPEEE
jgi:PKD repeat protein